MAKRNIGRSTRNAAYQRQYKRRRRTKQSTIAQDQADTDRVYNITRVDQIPLHVPTDVDRNGSRPAHLLQPDFQSAFPYQPEGGLCMDDRITFRQYSDRIAFAQLQQACENREFEKALKEVSDMRQKAAKNTEEAELLNDALHRLTDMYSAQLNSPADKHTDKPTDKPTNSATVSNPDLSKGNNKQRTKNHNKIPVTVVYSNMQHGPPVQASAPNQSQDTLRVLTATEIQNLREQSCRPQDNLPVQRQYFQCTYCGMEFTQGELYCNHVVEKHYLESCGTFWNQKCFQNSKT